MKLVVIYDIPDSYVQYERSNGLYEGKVPKEVVDGFNNVPKEMELYEWFTTSDESLEEWFD